MQHQIISLKRFLCFVGRKAIVNERHGNVCFLSLQSALSRYYKIFDFPNCMVRKQKQLGRIDKECILKEWG